MLVGLLSDAHGNHHAVAQALAWLDGRVGRLLFAGDAFSDHRFSNEVVELLRDRGATYVLGNHELSFLGPAGVAAHRRGDARVDLVEYVAGQPTHVRLVIDGVRVMMVHASPLPPYDQYVVPGHPVLRRAAELDTDVLVLGHAHVPYLVRAGDTMVINPGSIGRADGPGGEDQLTFAVLDTAARVARHYALDDGGGVSPLAFG
jgi:putative phosphoesterase